jgi:aminocarboxymuconate-semialdehyde decarboxylase
MDQQGVDVQALSINGYWWYAADRELARRIVQTQNEGLAKWVAAHPDRFVAMASVALQFPDLAAQQLEHAVKNLGARGASIGGHVDGEPPSTEKYDPFWAKAEQLGVMLFMHPQQAPGTTSNSRLGGKGALGNTIGNPLETTVFLSHLIFEGTLDRFPGLKICAAHAGGYLPSYLGRSDARCGRGGGQGDCTKLKPSEYFRRNLYIDSMIFREEGLRNLVAEVGADHMFYGTDFPFDWPVGIDFILNAKVLNDQQKEAILGGNLIKLLGLKPVSS